MFIQNSTYICFIINTVASPAQQTFRRRNNVANMTIYKKTNKP